MTFRLVDPVSIKFWQLIGAEALGAVLVLGGLVLSFLALAGKSHLIVELPGFKAKLSNAAPGAVVAVIGLILVFVSLHSHVVRVETTTTPVPQIQAPEPSPQTSKPDHVAPPPPPSQPEQKITTHTKTEVYLEGPLKQLKHMFARSWLPQVLPETETSKAH